MSEEFAIKMEASLKTWVSAWDSKGYSPDQLDKGVCVCECEASQYGQPAC